MLKTICQSLFGKSVKVKQSIIDIDKKQLHEWDYIING